MILFHNDYNQMCHPKVMEKLVSAASVQMDGYGEDAICRQAAQKILKACDLESGSVHFLVGGTQTNLTVIDAALRPHQAALCAWSGHINVHETGAVEATGHKVLGLPSTDGKITARQVADAMQAHLHDGSREHIAQPKLVYISFPTELGTIYGKQELTDLRAVCDRYGLYLFIDGARLGYGLTARDSDVKLQELAALSDVFYIGGTKVGAMFGEAVVIQNPDIAQDFRYIIKQHGAMLAKGWLLGLQFDALFTDDLYFSISQHANRLADQLRDTLDRLGYPLLIPGTTNQVFPILPDALLEKLGKDFSFSEQQRMDENHRAVRFCTSWATRQEDMDALCAELEKLTV